MIGYEDDAASPCECRRRRIEKARSSGLKGSLPKRYRGVSFERPPVSDMARQPGLSATVGAVRRYCETIDEQLDAGHGLWLMGGPGTGKTTLAMLASKAAIDAGRSVAIYSTPALLARIVAPSDGAGSVAAAACRSPTGCRGADRSCAAVQRKAEPSNHPWLSAVQARRVSGLR